MGFDLCKVGFYLIILDFNDCSIYFSPFLKYLFSISLQFRTCLCKPHLFHSMERRMYGNHAHYAKHILGSVHTNGISIHIYMELESRYVYELVCQCSRAKLKPVQLNQNWKLNGWQPGESIEQHLFSNSFVHMDNLLHDFKRYIIQECILGS